jgi:phosphoglucosamine mutase
MTRLFGTDGVRGVAGVDLTTDIVRDIAAAAAHTLCDTDDRTPVAVVGRDTRPSGPDLERAVVEGLTRQGVDVRVAGIVPTPAVAHLVAQSDATFGVVISASHNPAPDNGVKFFDHNGHKLTDDVEDAIESAMAVHRRTAPGTGTVKDVHAEAVSAYTDHLVASLPNRLNGVRVVVDCANGAAATVAESAYAGAGADVVVINTDLRGESINDGCGATHVEAVQRAVLEHGADVGIAHDGDADRCVAVDAVGDVVDGDAILAILALAAKDAGRLADDTVVTTVMTNLGFKRAMADHAIGVVETSVGDRYVLERMLADGLVIGGEQSGHLILLEHSPTGDGLLTGLHLLARIASTGRPLADLAAVMTRLPQVLVNVPVADRAAALADPELLAAVIDVENSLDGTGRVLVRASGTESLIRVMVEATTEDVARDAAARVAAFVR